MLVIEGLIMNQSMKKILVTTLTSSMVLSVTVPAMASTNYSASKQIVVAANVSTNQYSVDFIKKIDRFVKVDENTFQFFLDPVVQNSFSQEEIEQAQIIIDESNKSIRAILDEGFELMVTPSGTVKAKTSDSVGTFKMVGDIDTSKYFDWDYEWWGFRLWISPRLVSEIQDYNGYISGTAALATEVTLDLLKRRGIPVPEDLKGKLSIFAGALVSFGVTAFYRAYKDTGVFYHHGIIQKGFYSEDNLPAF